MLLKNCWTLKRKVDNSCINHILILLATEDTSLKGCFNKIVWQEREMEKNILNFDFDGDLIVNEGAVKGSTDKDMLRLKTRLAANGLTFIDVGGGGDCLFHCLAAIFYNNKKMQKEVRKVLYCFHGANQT